MRTKPVDIGGYCLAAACFGEGRPPIVFEAGAGDTGKDWMPIAEKAAEHTRVCIYDRAGAGLSDPSPHSHSFLQMTRELHALINNLNLEKPLIIVGHSLGALIAQLYAEEHPTDIAAALLIDPVQDNLFDRMRRLLSTHQFAQWQMLLLNPSVNKEGWSIEDLDDALQRVRSSRLPNVPVVILSSTAKTDLPSGWENWWPSDEYVRMSQDEHTKILKRTANSSHIVVPRSDHYIHRSRPSFVLGQLRSLIEEVRSSKSFSK